MLPERFGLYALICEEVESKAPLELEEVIKIIGLRRIEENQTLWLELTNLKEIYSDVHKLTVDFMGDLGLSDAGGKARSAQNDVPRLAAPSSSSSPHRGAARGSTLTRGPNNGPGSWERDCGASDSLSDDSLSADGVMATIRPHLSASGVESVRREILLALDVEDRELEHEIRQVQCGVDDGVDYLSPMNSNRSNVSADENPHTATGSTVEAGEVHSRDINVPGALKISKLQRMTKKGGVPGGGMSMSKSAPGLVAATMAVGEGDQADHQQHHHHHHHHKQQDQRIEQPPRKNSKSKVRGRLQAARDEKYFLDDDFL